jgi:hypothetical protein
MRMFQNYLELSSRTVSYKEERGGADERLQEWI